MDLVSAINPSPPDPYLISSTFYSFTAGDTVTVTQATSSSFPINLSGNPNNYFVATVTNYTFSCKSNNTGTNRFVSG
jgi:hypothetical protein